ncbi:Holliday junction branch migration protein RuvA [Patescibacteria group bacterium]|nr:Holliday junction branch migration protein RuvA [Patescibacteria group bacterium]
MIGYLKGTTIAKEDNNLLILVQGVGYQVNVPNFVWQACQLNQPQELLIYTHVKEDEISLYGFLNPTDKQMFTSLITVSGIGPKIALAIISHARGANKIIRAIQEADVDYFTTVKGLGKKGAQRLIVDLKPKLGSLKELEFETEQDLDLVEALKGLGFSSPEIKKAIKGIKEDLPLEEKIRLALKQQS